VSGSAGQGPPSCWGATGVPSFLPYDAVVTARAVAAILIVSIAIVAGCGASNPKPPASPSSTSSGQPSLTPVPGVASAAGASPSVLQTSTELGRIWDQLPPSFPRLPGATPTDLPEAVSGAFAIPASEPEAAAEALRVALTNQGYRVEVGTPLEDRTVVVTAGDTSGTCRIEARLTPRSGTVIMSVLYGAACPYR